MIESFIIQIATTFQYNLTGLLYLAGSGISISVGLLVLIHNPKNKTNFSFFLISLFGTNWQFSYAMVFLLQSEAWAYRWMGISYLVGVPLVSPSVFWFVQNWTNKNQRPNWTLFSFFSGAILGIIMFLAPEHISPFDSFPFGRFNAYGVSAISWIYLSAILTHMWLFALWGLIYLYKAWKETTIPNEKIQYRLFILAALIGYTASNDFFVTLRLNSLLLGYLSFSTYIVIMAYAIIRYQFLDMQMAIKRLSLILLIYGFLISILIPVSVPHVSG